MPPEKQGPDPFTNDSSGEIVKILLVEDTAFNREILADILNNKGWHTITADSGERALDILAQDSDFQIILMDIGLPGIDGIETARLIKKNPATRSIPTIALTAETDSARERLLAAGLDDYVVKNFDPDQLFAAVERQLGQKTARTDLTNHANYCALDFDDLFAAYPDKKALARIARAFFADTDKELILLGKAIDRGDQTEIMTCGHSLRGVAAIFSAKTLTAAVKELEDCLRHAKHHEIETAWQKVLVIHESLRNHVTNRLNLSAQAEDDPGECPSTQSRVPE